MSCARDSAAGSHYEACQQVGENFNALSCLYVYVANTILLAVILLINNSSGNYCQLMKFVITLAYGKTNYCVYVCACMREMKCLLT